MFAGLHGGPRDSGRHITYDPGTAPAFATRWGWHRQSPPDVAGLPPPKPRRPASDDEEYPQPLSTSRATDDERREELLAEIDELLDGR